MSSAASLGILPKLNPSGRKASSESSKEIIACSLNQMARTPDAIAEPVAWNTLRVFISIQANVNPVCACRRVNSWRTDSLGDGRTVIARVKTIQETRPDKTQNRVTDLRFRIELAISRN